MLLILIYISVASLLELYRQTERDGSVSVWDREKYRLASSHGLNHFAVKELTRDHHPDREDERTRVEAAGGQVLNWGGLKVCKAGYRTGLKI